MFRDLALNEAERLADAIAWASSGLKDAPEGTLVVDKGRKIAQYYWRTPSCSGKGTYLGKGQEELIRKLAQKDYEKRLLKAAREEKACIDRLLASYNSRDAKLKKPKQSDAHGIDVLSAVYEELSEQRKHLVKPYMLPAREHAAQWQAQEYVGNAHPFGSQLLYTRRDERVRSKSEVIIADALNAAAVPYHYEKPLHLGSHHAFYPDFTALNVRTRTEYIWEHFGLMDDQEYRDRALKKLSDYAVAGILAGKNLIVTFETTNAPLDTRIVNASIEHYLR